MKFRPLSTNSTSLRQLGGKQAFGSSATLDKLLSPFKYISTLPNIPTKSLNSPATENLIAADMSHITTNAMKSHIDQRKQDHPAFAGASEELRPSWQLLMQLPKTWPDQQLKKLIPQGRVQPYRMIQRLQQDQNYPYHLLPQLCKLAMKVSLYSHTLKLLDTQLYKLDSRGSNLGARAKEKEGEGRLRIQEENQELLSLPYLPPLPVPTYRSK